jgi:hypothetical protein
MWLQRRRMHRRGVSAPAFLHARPKVTNAAGQVGRSAVARTACSMAASGQSFSMATCAHISRSVAVSDIDKARRNSCSASQ